MVSVPLEKWEHFLECVLSSRVEAAGLELKPRLISRAAGGQHVFRGSAGFQLPNLKIRLSGPRVYLIEILCS